MSPVQIAGVEGRADRRAFIQLPLTINRDDPAWIVPLLFDIKKRLDRRKNPFFEHGDAAYFLARRAGRVVGRIAAIENRLHNEVHGDRLGFFGWFDCENDPEAATALIGEARAWTGARGLIGLRGPLSFSLNDECGVLVDGFEHPPYMMTPHNPPYYDGLLCAAGLETAMDLHSYFIDVRRFGMERVGRIVEKVKRRDNLRIRHFDTANFEAEIEKVKAIYNAGWADNWGHVPLTASQIDHMAKDLKPVLEPRLASFVEKDGAPIGFLLLLPNVNEILARMNGRLFPLGFLRLLTGIRKTGSARLMAMGLMPEWQKRGIDAVLYHDGVENLLALGKLEVEMGWVLDTNTVMQNTIERVGGRRYKTWRVYESTDG